MSRTNKITAGIAVSIVVLAAAMWFGVRRAQASRIDQLANDVIHYNQSSEAALRELATYRIDRARRLVEGFALGTIPLLDPQLQIQAIRIVAANATAPTLDKLGTLIRTDLSADIRSTVSDELYVRGCPTACVRSVVKYMKLVFDGRLNVEEQSVAGEKIDPEVMKILHEQNRRAYSKLNAILQKNGTVSLMVLMDEYGLGSGKPSTFLLNTLSHVRLDGACSKLGASFEGYPISNRKPGRSLSFKVA